MEYEIFTSADGSYIVCIIFEPMTVDDARDITIAVNRESVSSGIRKCLFDVRKAPFVTDVSRQYFFVRNDIPDIEFWRSCRSVVLIDPTDRSHDFMGKMLQDVGINMQVFEDYHRAIDWLVQ